MRSQFTVTAAPHRLQEPMSRRLADLRRNFENVMHCGSAFEPDDIDAACRMLRDAERDAVRRESADREVNAAVPVAFDLVCQTGDELNVLRALLSERHRGQPIDPDHQIAAAFARSIAFLEKGRDIVMGKVQP